MSGMSRRQAITGLLLATVSTAASGGQGHGQHRPRQQTPQARQRPPGQPGMQQGMQPGMGSGRLKAEDQGRIRDQDIYGAGMMSADERERYRKQLEQAGSDREWARIREEHQREMQARAKAQGTNLEPPVYGQHMMTLEERQRYTKRLQDAANDGEREMIRNEHREFIRNRAGELGLEVPPAGNN